MKSGGSGRRAIGQTATGLLWISPWLFGFVVFLAGPMIASFYLSLTDFPLLEAPLYVGSANYSDLLRDELFWTALKNTIIYAAFSIPLGTVIALALAGLLDRRTRLAGLFRTAIFVPTLVPVVASAMIWLWLFNGEHGLINHALGALNLPGRNWLDQKPWAMTALVIMSFWVVGQPVLIYLAALRDVPDHLYEAASLDGMGGVRRFIHVALPAISPVVLFNVIILTITVWQVFAIPYIMTEGGPDRATYFYTHYLYDNAFLYQKMGYASALAWIQMLIILVLTGLMFIVSKRLVYQRY